MADFENDSYKENSVKKIKFHARRFDVLVATDAIAMGLNLAIRRVIFSTLEKFDGITNRKLHPSVIIFEL